MSFGFVALFPLGTAISFALYILSTRRLSQYLDPIIIQSYTALLGTLICLPILFVGDLKNIPQLETVLPEDIFWIWLLGVGLFTQLGQIWLTEGLTALPAARATSINYVQVVFASLWGVLFFAEPITGGVVLGAICVLGATLISLSARTSRTQKA